MSQTVFIIDKHKVMRDSMRILIMRDSNWQVIGDCPGGEEAMHSVLALRPNVVVLDWFLIGINGLMMTRYLRAMGYTGGIVVVSMHGRSHFVEESKKAGADAYVLKEYVYEQLLAALYAADRRSTYYSPQLSLPETPHSMDESDLELLRHLAGGGSLELLANQRAVSLRSIEVQLARLRYKLRVDSVEEALQMGLGDSAS